MRISDWSSDVCSSDLPMSNPERIIRLRTVLTRTGLSRSTLYRKIAEGTFPAQLKISVHGTGWHESAIERWIRSEEHTSELQSLMRISYAVFCLTKNTYHPTPSPDIHLSKTK